MNVPYAELRARYGAGRHTHEHAVDSAGRPCELEVAAEPDERGASALRLIVTAWDLPHRRRPVSDGFVIDQDDEIVCRLTIFSFYERRRPFARSTFSASSVT